MKPRTPRHGRLDRAALVLLVAVGLHYLITLLVPQGADGSFAVERWNAAHRALAGPVAIFGMHRALYSPAFLAAVLALGALLLARAFIETPAAQLQARGRAHGWNAWFAPIASLLLGAVFVSLGVGTLTRYEGAVTLPSGRTVVDGAPAYDGLVAGLRFDDAFSGARIRLEDPLLAGESASPGVMVTVGDGRRARTSRLEPGDSARLGALRVRSEGRADSAMLAIEDAEGVLLDRMSVLFEPELAVEATVSPVAIDLGQGSRVQLRAGAREAPDEASGALSVSIASADGTWGAPLALEPGQAMPLPDGRWLRLISSAEVLHTTLSYDRTAPYRDVLLVLALIAALTSVFGLRGSTVVARVRTGMKPARDVAPSAPRAVDASAQAEPIAVADSRPRQPESRTLPAVAVALTVVLLLAAGLTARRGRTFRDEQAVYTVSSAAEAHEAFREAGVRGRILVLLDRDARIIGGVRMADFMESLEEPAADVPVTEHNLTSALVYAGIARSVYYVPPPAAWEAESLKYATRSDALQEGSGSRVRFYGADIHLSDPEQLEFGERVIVYIAADVANEYDPALLRELTDPEFADVVVKQVTP